MAIVGVDSGSLQADSQPKSFGLVWGRLAPFYIHQMNGNGNENISNAPPTVDRRRIT